MPPDHLLLDRSPNIGPLIHCWELDKIKNCRNKSFRISKVLTLLYQQLSDLLISQRYISGPRLGALSNNRWSGGIMSIICIKRAKFLVEIPRDLLTGEYESPNCLTIVWATTNYCWTLMHPRSQRTAQYREERKVHVFRENFGQLDTRISNNVFKKIRRNKREVFIGVRPEAPPQLVASSSLLKICLAGSRRRRTMRNSTSLHSARVHFRRQQWQQRNKNQIDSLSRVSSCTLLLLGITCWSSSLYHWLHATQYSGLLAPCEGGYYDIKNSSIRTSEDDFQDN